MQDHKNQSLEMPAGLLAIAGNRDLVTTNEFAEAFNVTGQTVRKLYCMYGEVYGLVPVKVGNRLLWSVRGIAQLMKGCT